LPRCYEGITPKGGFKLGLTEIRELRQLRDENARLTRLVNLVTYLTLAKYILGAWAT
jgi:hypothetical protein